ncbi:MBL fold metallo-hydrolase [Paenibacillus sp. J2TS4]|uniref:MBL fold metallo-hydrolase n=1 Tax=Paenibacillus sp. J2TS4 TaxID=2807194 RepID=UPI001B263DCD|nr:MBL fold metallo-hydrolase [Paenibacillus sp. J2TS4]GIP32855.1 MBL fold hydrolase [Paenibacillus sp. J2TS4]
MELKLRMVGTGGAFSARYANNNALMTAGSFTLLVDCGVTAIRSLREMDVPLPSIDGVFVTHQHADHVGGLEEFAFQMLHIHRRKPKLFIPASLREVLWENTLKGGMENIEAGLTALDDYFDVIELHEGHEMEVSPGLRLNILPTQHIAHKSSYSLLINGQMYYSSDTRFNRARLEELHSQGVRYILHECKLYGAPGVHTTLEELLTLPEEVQSKIQLMHYGDDMEQYIGRTGIMTFIRQHELYTYSME